MILQTISQLTIECEGNHRVFIVNNKKEKKIDKKIKENDTLIRLSLSLENFFHIPQWSMNCLKIIEW